ncbi:formylmethanofuran dehydrogenase subunit C [Ancylobacter oerskovii]|uniref:Formylmethanofuran dehydrogenase subunit C n=1 Tax=Ancylobacter oerskovii TaxID=459519 RepID=A0ABW4Z2T0_9HYPH|nr:formylmethanofuran dehydrogenase subunit C [Ancylobacter oerskovii]MBS7544908.1 formylmethanofuran dehydrogenase subunit C [Ancylobacter oerskovii]
MSVVLRLKAPLAARLDLEGLTPAALAGKAPAEVEAIALPHGGRSVALGELFAIRAGTEGRLVLEGGDARLDGVGAGLAAGEILVEGDVGAHAGRGMAGGVLRIGGHAGDELAAGLTGGRIEIDGNAGARAGAAPSGARRGMAGGVVLIRGHAGERAGERQRGGLILIEGDAGAEAATDMIAGTLAVGGRFAPGAGRGMKRGTLIARATPDLAEGFADTGTHDLVALRLIARRVPDLAGLIAAAVRARRLVGDRLQGGLGEVLVLEEGAASPA